MSERSPAPGPDHVLVTARNEAARLGPTLQGLRTAFPDARLWVADDGSSDDTAAVAARAGAEVVGCARPVGKGGAATAGARRMLEQPGEVLLLCDADLGASVTHLRALTDAVSEHRADVAVGAFARRRGGGLGLAVGFARWAIKRRCGLEAVAPISGQRALSRTALEAVLPFAPRFGMEMAMTIDAVRGGFRVLELPLHLEHRATGRTPAGFAHRGRQLVDFWGAYRIRR